MKKFILIIFLIYFTIDISHSQSGWYTQESGVDNDLLAVYFLNINTGIIAGSYGIILKTTNGGLNWDSVNNPAIYDLSSICAVDSNTILISGDGRIIIKSTNSGDNWYQITSIPYGFNFHDIEFIDNLTGYIAGSDGVILKSTNSGEIWFNLNHPYPFSHAYYGLSFINANTGYVVGHGGIPESPIIKTTDGGLSWLRQFSATLNALYAVKFINPDTGLICGSSGIIRRSTNGGTNWDFISNPSNSLNDLSFITPEITYAVGGGGIIIKSSNGGLNWSQQISGTDNHLVGVYFLDDYTGYAVGTNGTILKTTSGGIVGINPINNFIPEHFNLLQNYPNPFNPVTNLEYGISKPVFVSLKIYDVLGNEVETLVNEKKSAGYYSVKWDGANFASGVYYYKLSADNFSETKKMMLVR